MGSHSLLLIMLGLSCCARALGDVSSQHFTRNQNVTERLTGMAEQFGATEFDELGMDENGPEAATSGRKVKRLASEEDESPLSVYQGVMGRPGVDFPILPRIPRTTFSCRSVPSSGYYADMDTDCQVFHICDGGRKISFLCPNGTIFRQSHLICDWWWTVDCGSSREHYEASAEAPADDRSRTRQNQFYSNEQKSTTNTKQQPPSPRQQQPARQKSAADSSRQRERSSHDNAQLGEQQYRPEQRRQNTQPEYTQQQPTQSDYTQQQQRVSSESVHGVAPSSPLPGVLEGRDTDQRRRGQNSYFNEFETNKQSKPIRSTTFGPQSSQTEVSFTHGKESQQPAETASFVNGKRNINGSRRYEIISRNVVPSEIVEKVHLSSTDQAGNVRIGLEGTTESTAHLNTYAFSRKVRPAVSERRGGRHPTVRWSNGEFETTVDLSPTSRQGQREYENKNSDGSGILVTESPVRSSKYHSTSKQYVELDRSKSLNFKAGSQTQSVTEQKIKPIVVRVDGPSTPTWQFTTVAPEDLPITDIYRPTGTQFTLEDELGGRNFFTTQKNAVNYVSVNRQSGAVRKDSSSFTSERTGVTEAAESDEVLADSANGSINENNDEVTSDIPITDVSPPKELWFTHEDLAFMSTTQANEFDSVRTTLHASEFSETSLAKEESSKEEEVIEESETGHKSTEYTNSNNGPLDEVLSNCTEKSSTNYHQQSVSVQNELSKVERRKPPIQVFASENVANYYTAPTTTAETTEMSEPKLFTDGMFKETTINHMTASSSDFSISVTDDNDFYDREVTGTTSSSFEKTQFTSLWSERESPSTAFETSETVIPKDSLSDRQLSRSEFIPLGKTSSTTVIISGGRGTETSLSVNAVSRGISAPFPVTGTSEEMIQVQNTGLQYVETNRNNNKEDFDSLASTDGRSTDLFPHTQLTTVSTAVEENENTESFISTTSTYDTTATKPPLSFSSDNAASNSAVENIRRAYTPVSGNVKVPRGRSAGSLVEASPDGDGWKRKEDSFVNSEILGTFADSTSSYENRNVKEDSYISSTNVSTEETTEGAVNSTTATQNATSFRRRGQYGKPSSTEPTVTSLAPRTASNRLSSSRKAVIFVEGQRRRLTTTTTTPSVIQRVLSLRQKTTPLTIPFRSATGKAVTLKAQQNSEQLSKSLLPPKDSSEGKAFRRGSTPSNLALQNAVSKSRTSAESHDTKTRVNVPPLNRPDTLNSLAVYFGLPEDEMEESGVSNRITQMMNDLVGESVNTVNSSAKEIPINLPPLLTQLTRDSYSALFSLTKKMAGMDTSMSYGENGSNINDTGNYREGKGINFNETRTGIENLLAENLTASMESNNSLAKEDVRRLRELAQIFSRALTAYLKDPADFRKILSQARPTEPANNTFETDVTTVAYETTKIDLRKPLKPLSKDDDEVLDYSDVSKTPTMGFLSSTDSPFLEPLIQARTLSKPNAAFEDKSGVTGSRTNEEIPAAATTARTQQDYTDSSEVTYESLEDHETSHYNPLTTRGPLDAGVDSTNAIAFEVNNLFVTETSASETLNDYTAPPESQKFTGPAYGPSNDVPAARAAGNPNKSQFGGFQNNSRKHQTEDVSEDLSHNLTVNERMSPLAGTSFTYRFDLNDSVRVASSNRDKQGHSKFTVNVDTPDRENVFAVTTRSSFDELSTLQNSVVPEEVNNLAVTTTNAVEKIGSDIGSYAQTVSTTTTGDAVSETISANFDTSFDSHSNVNNAHESTMDQEVGNRNEPTTVPNIIGATGFTVGEGFKLEDNQQSIKQNVEEVLVVSDTSSFSSSLKQKAADQKSKSNQPKEVKKTSDNNLTDGVTYSSGLTSLETRDKDDKSGEESLAVTEPVRFITTQAKPNNGENTIMVSHVTNMMPSDSEDKLSSGENLPEIGITHPDIPQTETATQPSLEYSTTEKLTRLSLKLINTEAPKKSAVTDEVSASANQKQNIISPSNQIKEEIASSSVGTVEIYGSSRMASNTLTSPAPQVTEATAKRPHGFRSNRPKQATTKSPKVTISSRGFSFATSVDESRDILEQERASLRLSATTPSVGTVTSVRDSAILKSLKLHIDSPVHKTESDKPETQNSANTTGLTTYKRNFTADNLTVDIKSGTRPLPLSGPVEKSDSTSSTPAFHQIPHVISQQRRSDEFDPTTMNPEVVSHMTASEVSTSINESLLEQSSTNSHSRTGKHLAAPERIAETNKELFTEVDVPIDLLPREHNLDPITEKTTIAVGPISTQSNEHFSDKNYIRPSAATNHVLQRSKSDYTMTYEEKETLNHLQEIFELDTATAAKAGKLFMELNDTSKHALMDMMKQAASNSTMRQLVVVVVNKSMGSSKDFTGKSSKLPCDKHTESEVKQPSIAHNMQKNTTTIRRRSRRPKNSANNQRQSISTTEPAITTYHSQDQKYQRLKSAVVPTISVLDLITSKNLTFFDEVPTLKPGVVDHSQLSAPVSEPEESVSQEADARVVELLRSLYSLAAQWG